MLSNKLISCSFYDHFIYIMFETDERDSAKDFIHRRILSLMRTFLSVPIDYYFLISKGFLKSLEFKDFKQTQE
jgi:hypothetical protein